MAKIRRAKLPFKFLNEFEKEANQELQRLLTQGMSIIESEIRSATPDWDEQAFEGSNMESLQKALLVRKNAIRDYQRRIIHGAPIHLNQLTQEEIEGLFDPDLWEGGLLKFEGFPVRGVGEYEISDETVPLSSIPVLKVKADDLKAALGKRREKIVLIKITGDENYHLVKGSAAVFAAKLVNLPAVEAEVRHYEKYEIDSHENGLVELATIHSLKFKLTSYYYVPSHMEPLSELCRRLPLDYIESLHRSEYPSDFEGAITKLKELERKRYHVWVELYNDAIEYHTPSEANRIVRDNPKWMRIEDRTEAAHDKVTTLENEWEKNKGEWDAALTETFLYLQEDGMKLREQTIAMIHHEAHMGKIKKEVHEMGSPIFAYEPGETVELLGGDTIWHKGKVIRATNDGLRVRRENGEYRIIEDPASIRKFGEGRIELNSDPMDQSPKEIRLDKFNVLIPAGSNALKIETALQPITEEMNSTPLNVNFDTWKTNQAAEKKELERLTSSCHELAGRAFKPNSPKDCAKLLIEEMGLPVQRVSKSGVPSIDKDALAVWENMGEPLAGLIIQARESQSKLSQLNSWESFAKAGTVQCQWNQLGTPMGRYSCEDPNLQNRITAIRETIEAPKGFKLISTDLGQAEYVTWASLSKDPTLSASFLDGTDLHTRMFEEVKAVVGDIDFHEPDPRQVGKTVNFALLYLMQPFTLAKKLGISFDDARDIIKAYEERAPLATTYIQDYLAQAKKTGRVSTYYGRTRFMPEMIKAKGNYLHQLNKTAWHHHCSGTAADIVKMKQIKIARGMLAEGFELEDARIALNMHDEIIVLARDGIVEDVKTIMRMKFEEEIPGFLPFRLDQRAGNNWLEISK